MRKQTTEQVFADAKERRGLRYTHHRDLARVSCWVRLKFAAMNLKKLALRAWEGLRLSQCYLCFATFYPLHPSFSA
ncbi:MAG: hypothetical protein HFF00_04480 [Ruminiclostridium sp.]|nr:hypothetical protein [Ruminiclostridium sp.]